MEDSAIDKLVGGSETGRRIYKTIETSNNAGGTSSILTVEEREELESRGLNPYWDTNVLRNTLRLQAQQNGVWFEKSYLEDKTLIHDQKSTGTSENDMYLNANGKTVTKLNNLSYVRGPEFYHNLML